MKMMVLGAGDAHVLQSVAPGVFDDPLDAAATAAFLGDPRHHIVVAVDEGTVVGFASAVQYVHPDKPRAELWINEVGVAAHYQRHGIGRAILSRLLALARDLGCREAWVLTTRTNEAALRLYASCGGVQDPADQVMYSFPVGGA
jgi:GNAT superfamily N-acetyltransferase